MRLGGVNGAFRAGPSLADPFAMKCSMLGGGPVGLGGGGPFPCLGGDHGTNFEFGGFGLFGVPDTLGFAPGGVFGPEPAGGPLEAVGVPAAG